MIDHAKRKLRWDKAHFGDVKYIAVADNDQAGEIGACECDKCTAARKRDGGSGLIFDGKHEHRPMISVNLELFLLNLFYTKLLTEVPWLSCMTRWTEWTLAQCC